MEAFTGELSFLSNFEPCNIEWEGFIFPSSENAFQASKLTCPALKFTFTTLTPGQSKRLARTLPVRENWKSIKVQVMKEILEVKFSIPELREKLIATGSTPLVEVNTWNDKFWGVCNGSGENRLGKILMDIRNIIERTG